MKSDFLFIYLERSFGGMSQGCRPYLGVGYVLAYGGYQPDQARIYYSDTSKTWNGLAQDICSLANKGVGFTVYESNYRFVSKLATRIKRLRPNLLIMCGGPCATFSSKRILEDNSAFDLCVRGEAELTFKQLAVADFSRKAWSEIPALAYMDKGEYRTTDYGDHYYVNTEIHDALSGLPSPYLSAILSPEHAPALGIATSRGCPHSCTYCSFSAVGNRRIRFFPESQVLEELRLICNYFKTTGKSAGISFNDDSFTINIARAKRILDALKDIRPENLSFRLMSRPDSVNDPEFLELARMAGIVEIGFGLESASPEVLSLVKKVRPKSGRDMSRERAYIKATQNAVQVTRKHGINPTVSIILGLPGDTMQSGEKTMDLIKRLSLSTYYHNILKIYDGTELADDHARFGLERLSTVDSPFPSTKHPYDTSALPVMPNEIRSKEYLAHPMIAVLYGLTGLAASDGILGYECIYLDLENKNELLDWDALPIGTFFIGMPGVKSNGIWRKKGFGSCEIHHGDSGHLIDPEVFNDSPFLPVIIFPGENRCYGNETRACLEFIKMGLKDDIPKSEHNHWRLPFAACGLLQGECPGRSGKIRSQAGEKSQCVYYHEPLDFKPPFSCKTCEQCYTCTKCIYLLKQFGEAYCEYQRSDKPLSLRAYLKTHLHALRDRNARINALPAIHLEKLHIQQPGVRVMSIDGKMALFKI